MVPESEKSFAHVAPKLSDCELLVEICTLILHDRLAAENHQAELASLLKSARHMCSASDTDVVIDIFLHDVVLESWVLARALLAAPKKADHKTVLRSLLGFSPYTAWRRSLTSKAAENKALLRAISASVSSMKDRRALCATAAAAPHVCPPFALAETSVSVLVHRADRVTLDSLALEALPLLPAAMPPALSTAAASAETRLLRTLSPPAPHSSKHEPVHVHSSSHNPHHHPSPSPDPRRRALPHAAALDAAPRQIAPPPPRAYSTVSPLSPPLAGMHSPPPHGTPHPLAGSVVDLRSRSSSLSRSLSRSPRSCLLGNYEESLLAGSLPLFAAHPVDGFTADLSASGLVCAKRVRLPMAVRYYQIPEQEAPSPYVGTIDLAGGLAESKGRYRVPAAGVLQVLISNPERTGIKVFMVKYNLKAMPPNTHTFLRQRTFVGQSHGPARSPCASQSPQYAIHVRFMSSKTGKIFLYKDIRLLFAPRAPDMTEYQHTTTEGPPEPVFAPIERVITPRVLFPREPCSNPSGPPPHSPLAAEVHSHDRIDPVDHDSGAASSPEPPADRARARARDRDAEPFAPPAFAADALAAAVRDSLHFAS